LPFHAADSGSHTSILISESLVGRVVAATRQNAGRFLYALSIESYLATYTTGRFHLSHGIFGPTEIRMLLIAGNILLRTHPYASLARRQVLSFDVGGAVAIAGMAVMVLSAAVRHTVLLYKEEALP
jgi:hypothetical protein